MQKLAGFAALVLISFSSTECMAQNVFKDYVINSPRQFAPMDPWTTGRVFRTHMGHGGIFYNCDGQEDKRCSPYIYWQGQSNCDPDTNSWYADWNQQIDEVKQRIRWGKGCDVPHYDVPWLPSDRFGSIVADAKTSNSTLSNASNSKTESLLKNRAADKSNSIDESRKGILR